MLLAFLDTRMPSSERDLFKLRVQTVTSDDKLIDFYDNLDAEVPLFHVDPAPFFSQQVSTATVKTYTESALTVTLNLANSIFEGSYVLINIPAQIQIPESITAKAIENVEESIAVEYVGQFGTM